MTIVMTNEFGCLIEEFEVDTDNATEAMEKFLEADISFEVGDMIQIRR